eukprot:199900-Chlamydomonas_euryale.AAC.6
MVQHYYDAPPVRPLIQASTAALLHCASSEVLDPRFNTPAPSHPLNPTRALHLVVHRRFPNPTALRQQHSSPNTSRMRAAIPRLQHSSTNPTHLRTAILRLNDKRSTPPHQQHGSTNPTHLRAAVLRLVDAHHELGRLDAAAKPRDAALVVLEHPAAVHAAVGAQCEREAVACTDVEVWGQRGMDTLVHKLEGGNRDTGRIWHTGVGVLKRVPGPSVEPPPRAVCQVWSQVWSPGVEGQARSRTCTTVVVGWLVALPAGCLDG